MGERARAIGESLHTVMKKVGNLLLPPVLTAEEQHRKDFAKAVESGNVYYLSGGGHPALSEAENPSEEEWDRFLGDQDG